jgi:hypothetical protein
LHDRKKSKTNQKNWIWRKRTFWNNRVCFQIVFGPTVVNVHNEFIFFEVWYPSRCLCQLYYCTPIPKFRILLSKDP